ncbi:MAG: HD domain-containing protein, partial [Desulfobacterales bacterium]
YLFSAYQQKRRRLGPMAVLHPLRVTALFARNQERLNLIGLLSVLFHDIMEDINPYDFEVNQWIDMEGRLYHLLERMGDANEAKLLSNIVALTRIEKESYYQYIGRLLENAIDSPQLVHVKLADRLDNTLDMRIDLEDPLAGVDFFQNIFQLLFVNNYRGYKPANAHPPATAMNGARRLYQLFKNTVLLSLIRQHKSQQSDRALSVFFEAVCDASLQEAQRTLIHLIGFHIKDTDDQRKLLLEAMEYCFSGRIDLVTKPDRSQLLDGLFSTYFAHNSKKVLHRQLDILYQNKELMIQASIAFVVIFLHFLNDSKYYVHGISQEGIKPR